MNQYTIVFSLENFDEPGEEHRLTTHATHSFVSGTEHKQAAEALVKFAAKLVHGKPSDLAIRRIKIRSIWLQKALGSFRVSAKEFLTPLVKSGETTPRGREEQRIPTKPKPLVRHVRRS